ncbi:MAG: hypothetical protein SNJ78_07250, partial [Spirochaetales bacterium]
SRGSVRLLTNEYVTYRGGRQSNQRKDHNVEFLLWISQRRGKSSPTRRSPSWEPIQEGTPEEKIEEMTEIDRLLELNRIRLLSKRVYRPEVLRARFSSRFMGKGVYRVEIPLHRNCKTLDLDFYHLVELKLPDLIRKLPLEDLRTLQQELEKVVCTTRMQEVEALVGVIKTLNGRERDKYVRKLLRVLRKLAHRKYKELFWQGFQATQQVLQKEEIEPSRPPAQGTAFLSQQREEVPKAPLSVLPLEEASRKEKKARWLDELEKIRQIALLRFSNI